MSTKLHLGCGDKHFCGFVHVDRAAYDHVDFQQDVGDLANFADGSVSLVYACHVLEYFDLREAVDVLREWRRVLEPSGMLRLAVPDFNALVKVYEVSGCLPAILGPLYGRMTVMSGGCKGSYIGDGSSRRWISDPGFESDIVVRVIYHKTVYTFALLSTILSAVGFRGIRRWDWRETEHAHVDDCSQAYWPGKDDPNAIHVSLNVEAVKAE